MERILHIKSSVHTHPHRYKPTWQKVNRCSFCLCYRKKLCFVLLIHKLNLEDMKSAYGARRPMANTNIYGRNMLYSKLFSFQVVNRFLFVCFSDFVLPFISKSSFSHHFFSVITSKGKSLKAESFETISRISLLIGCISKLFFISWQVR